MWVSDLARRKGAPVAAKARGVQRGNPTVAAALRRAGKGGQPLRATVTANAHAAALAPVIAARQVEGHTSHRAVAATLDAARMRTHRDGRWHVATVRNLRARIDRLAPITS